MYAKPTLRPLDATVATAICCQIYASSSGEPVRGPLCGTVVCAAVDCTVYLPTAQAGSS